jgi:hypothetical protein
MSECLHPLAVFASQDSHSRAKLPGSLPVVVISRGVFRVGYSLKSSATTGHRN